MNSIFIDGQFVEASDDLMDVVRSVQAANRTLPKWTQTQPIERATILTRMAELIRAHADLIAQAAEADLGTPRSNTLRFSVSESAAHFSAHADQLSRDTTDGFIKSTDPVGIVGVITPASDPFLCLSSRVAPALASANAVIAKVSSATGESGTLFARLLNEAGLPAGIFACLLGRGDAVGDAVVRHPAISTISFMGSTDTGRSVAIAAAESFKKIHLSLGAKNPVLVFAQAQLDEVVPKIARLCLGAHPSQSLKASRLFIQESIFKSTLEKLQTEFNANPQGSAQMKFAKPGHVKAYQGAVQQALKENGKAVPLEGLASKEPTGIGIKPYLFADLTNCSTLQQNEIAGPFILAQSFKYQHEAIKRANVSPYGRISYVFEPDPEKAQRVASKLESGSVFINRDHAHFDPMDEVVLLKNSGFLPEGGRAMLQFFTRKTRIFS